MARPRAVQTVAGVEERALAASALDAIRASLADRSAAGEPMTAHILFSSRRGMWMRTWTKLPGLMMDVRKRAYCHTLLPGWEYTAREMKTEMLDDLDLLATTGERPKEAARHG